jgi:hypothetical protein
MIGLILLFKLHKLKTMKYLLVLILLFASLIAAQESDRIYCYVSRQNYPNPFNPTTKINYQFHELNFVSIKFHNVWEMKSPL